MAGFKLASAHVLVTGGSDGIGKALAKRLVGLGATVAVTGRTVEKLDQLRLEMPEIMTIQSDISDAAQRESLVAQVNKIMPAVNVIINNAGYQRRIPLALDEAPWLERQAEIETLFVGPIHLNHLLIPTLLRHEGDALIVNVTSGGAFIPQPFAPIYSACKAALHSYTVNLRYALQGTNCRVVELIPPAVATGLGGTDVSHGTPLKDFCDDILHQLVNEDVDEIGYGIIESDSFKAFRAMGQALFETSAQRFEVTTYKDR